MVGFGGVPYGVSKAGGILLTKSLAMEVANEGIRINAIAPATLAHELRPRRAGSVRAAQR